MNNHWDAQEVFLQWLERAFSPTLSNSRKGKETTSYYHFKDDDEIPLEELERALIRCARIVDEFGSQYLCVFERIEAEIEKKKQQAVKMNKVKTLLLNSSSNDQSDLIQPQFFLRKTWAIAVAGA